MTLKLEKMSTPRTKIARLPEGTYMGRVASVVDLGIQPQTDWTTGEATDPKARALITWELPTEFVEITDEEGNVEQRPRWISKEYTLSNFDQSNLMKLLTAITSGKIGDISELLNIACMVNVGSTVNDNAKIVSVMAVPTGMEVGELDNPAAYFDFDEPNEELYKGLPAWVQGKITEAENYNGFADEWKGE
jgi:hypothetical protein